MPSASTTPRRRPSGQQTRCRYADVAEGEPTMMGRTPHPEEHREERRPRDAGYWARYVETLEVSDVPEGAVNLNVDGRRTVGPLDRKSTRLNSSHANISYAVFCLKKKTHAALR